MKCRMFTGLLWTAPEVLNATEPEYMATREADVYSFGIILHEIFYRMGTFAGNNNSSPSGNKILTLFVLYCLFCR